MVSLRLAVATGCLALAVPSQAADQVDPFSVVQIALSSSGIGLSIAGIAARDNRDFPACVTVEVLRSSFDAAYTVVRDRAGGMPAISGNLSGCLSFASRQPRAVLERQVGELVESLVGSVLRSTESALAASGGLPCRDAVVLYGVFAYLEGLTGSIVDELVEPDGGFSLRPVTFDRQRCEEPTPPPPTATPAPPQPDEAKTGAARANAGPPVVAADPGASDSPSARTANPTGGGVDIATRLATLKSLLDQGLITETDYEQRKASILSEL